MSSLCIKAKHTGLFEIRLWNYTKLLRLHVILHEACDCIWWVIVHLCCKKKKCNSNCLADVISCHNHQANSIYTKAPLSLETVCGQTIKQTPDGLQMLQCYPLQVFSVFFFFPLICWISPLFPAVLNPDGYWMFLLASVCALWVFAFITGLKNNSYQKST